MWRLSLIHISIRKVDYLKSASVMHGINITYENEVLAVTLPSLLPKRRQRQRAVYQSQEYRQ